MSDLLKKIEAGENTLAYLTVEKGEGLLVFDIETLSGLLSLVVTESDCENSAWKKFVIPLGWALRNLQEIYDEVK